MKYKKIFVTGGAGFIGSRYINELSKFDVKILNFDKLTYATSPNTLEHLAAIPNYELYQGDICQKEHIDAALDYFKPDLVVNFAAESHVDKSISGPEAFIETNILGTYRLLEACLRYRESSQIQNFLYHHISTDEVYGSLSLTDKNIFSEEHKYDPASPYSASKASSDNLVNAWHKTYGLPILITNCSNNYGPFQYPEKLIPKTILNALQGKSIPIYGAGQNVRDWLFVDDHVRALILLQNKERQHSVYNIGGNCEMNNLDLVNFVVTVLARTLGKDQDYFKPLISFSADRLGHDLRYAIDTSRINKEFAWQPETAIENGIVQTIKWYMNNQNWWV